MTHAATDVRGGGAGGAGGGSAAPAPPLIRLEHVNKTFGEQMVLDDYCLDIAPAQTLVIMGPSGCGKSVTLKHIVGLLKPDTGRIFFDGTRTDHL
ncbi:MAG: ATP-binding cassette domain-containing protein, partial [Planctomycetota bacterium]|nr:ATP-binding cassette domain-containing protein [Planctomycetota bacterium]